MAPPRVTVAIPTWNGGRFVAEAIQSILSQSFTDLDIVIVDDHSTDSTVEAVHSFADPRMTLHENGRRLGIPGNWNHALSLARGEYVCLFHQDDRMEPDNLARKVRVLDSDPTIGLVHSAIEIIVEPSAPYPPAQWVEEAAEDFIVDHPVYFRRLVLEGNIICAPTVLARRQALVEAGGFDPELGFACDYALWMRVCLDRRVAFLSQPLVKYRWHADNETHRFRFEKGVQEALAACHKVLSDYGRRPGREQEAELLRASVDVLARVRRWAAELDSGRGWLEEQVRNWQAEAERRDQIIAELRLWNEQLEGGKAWLEQHARNWQAESERRDEFIAELRGWIGPVGERQTAAGGAAPELGSGGGAARDYHRSTRGRLTGAGFKPALGRGEGSERR
jgi:glycosyltransferase involved in cell wall biosynthesis